MSTALLEPASGQISGSSHTDFPVLIVPSEHTNIGTLTQAEADSVRIYTDAALTNEIAREIVSADEIWAKVPSLSSTTDLYFDWDGSRADYAVTDTYGRNAVWSDYDAVYHLDDTADSSGNGFTLTNKNSVSFVSGKIGGASDSGTTNDTNNTANTKALHTSTNPPPLDGALQTAFTVQYWVNPNDFDGAWNVTVNDGNDGNNRSLLNDTTPNVQAGGANINYGTVSAGTASFSNGMPNSLRFGVTLHAIIPADPTSGANTKLDEVRLRPSALSADWITTEYNNQNDNAAFWDDSAVGGGGGTTFTPIVSMIT